MRTHAPKTVRTMSPGARIPPRFVEQRSVPAATGNQATLRRLQAREVSQPSDHLEVQASRMAEAALERSGGAVATPSSRGGRSSSGPGQPLAPGVRGRLEAGFGRDFSAVRVHDTPADRRLATELSARAFTHRGHIWLGHGQRADDLPLIAHELAHVVQQTDAGGANDGLIQRFPDAGDALAAPVPSAFVDNPLVHAMAQFASIRPSRTQSNLYEGTFEGKRFTLTVGQYFVMRENVRTAALGALRHASLRAETALDRYRDQQEVNKRHWIVSWFVKDLGHVRDPGPRLLAFVEMARAFLADARLALDAGDFVAAAERIGEGERDAEKAALMVSAYVDQLIGSAEMTVTMLKGVKIASGLILFLCAVAATGGAAGAGATALGLEGVAGTTTLLGTTASTATWAVGITTSAAIAEEVGVGIVAASDGDRVDWGEIAVHAAIQVVLARFSPTLGQRLSKGLFSAAVWNPAVRNAIARIGMARVVTIATNLLMHEGAQLFSTIIEDAVRALRGKSITWGDFGKHVHDRLLDPRGLFMSVLAGALGGTQPEPSRQPAGPPAASTVAPSSTAKPKGYGETMKELNVELGLKGAKTTNPPATPPPGAPQATAASAFRPTAAESAAAYAKEPVPMTAAGTPIRVSPGASPRGSQFQSASMTKSSAFARTTRADIGEAQATRAALSAGETVLETPQGTNVGGRSDFVTAARDPSGKLWVIANDAKTRTSPGGTFADPTPGLRPNWNAQVKGAVDRAAASDPVFGAELRAALAAGRVWVRQVNVDLSPAGQGAISGIEPPRPVGWGALLGPRDLKDDERR